MQVITRFFKLYIVLSLIYSVSYALTNSKPAPIPEIQLPTLYQIIKTDTSKLMSFYSPQAKWWQDKNCIHPGGCVGTEQSVWVWANATYVMANYQELMGDNRYQSIIKTVYTYNWRHIYPKKYFDDDLWWALALIRVYEVTHDHDALIKAQLLVAYVEHAGRQNSCYGSGGVYWNLAKTEVGTIANMLYIIDNAKLYQITKNESYKMQANHTWNWYRKSGLLTQNHTVFDHYAIQHKQCGQIYDWPFTYNIGVLLSALSSLAEINNDQAFITYGKKVALKSLDNFAPNGTITEYCDDTFECAKNVFLFKGIYAYELANFALATKDPLFIHKVQQILANNLITIRQIQKHRNVYAFNWSMPVNVKRYDKLYNPADILSHLSVVYLELSNLLIIRGESQTLVKSLPENKH